MRRIIGELAMRRFLCAIAFAWAAVACAGSCFAADLGARDLPPGLQIPDAARPGPDFDAERATDAYVALLSPKQRASSDAYFEGGYWLILWGFLYGIVVAAILLCGRISQRMRDFARRISHRPWLNTMIYVALWVLVVFVLSLP